MKLSFDIETEALPKEAIEHLKPAFKAPANYKDEAKIADNIAQQEQEWYANAALSPLSGRILAIGVKEFNEEPEYLQGDEGSVLEDFWTRFGSASEYDLWHGHNIHSFDVPYIVKRSWANAIKVPFRSVLADNGFVNSRRFVDTMRLFQCGDKQSAFISLDRLATFLGIPGKLEDIGPKWGQIYRENPTRALAYLRRDLEIVEAAVKRMTGGAE